MCIYTKTVLRNFRAKKQMEIRGQWVRIGRFSAKARWHLQSLRGILETVEVFGYFNNFKCSGSQCTILGGKKE